MVEDGNVKRSVPYEGSRGRYVMRWTDHSRARMLERLAQVEPYNRIVLDQQNPHIVQWFDHELPRTYATTLSLLRSSADGWWGAPAYRQWPMDANVPALRRG